MRETGVLTKEQETSIFSNCESLHKIHEELLAALSLAERPNTDALACTAAAFDALAPYMRAYSAYCANFVMATERLERHRARSAALDSALREAEIQAGQTTGSMLIKPVQVS